MIDDPRPDQAGSVAYELASMVEPHRDKTVWRCELRDGSKFRVTVEKVDHGSGDQRG